MTPSAKDARPRIPVTQYLLPDGRQREGSMSCPDEATAAKAYALIESGFRFEAEILTTGQASLTVHDPESGEDVAIVLCANGPGVIRAMGQLIEQATEEVLTRAPEPPMTWSAALKGRSHNEQSAQSSLSRESRPRAGSRAGDLHSRDGGNFHYGR